MDAFWLLALLGAFLAVALGIEGVWLYWNDRYGPQARRLARRLSQVASGFRGSAESDSGRPRLRAQPAGGTVAGWFALTRAGRWLDTVLRQAGSPLTASRFFAAILSFAIVGGLVSWLLGASTGIALGVVLMLVILPLGLLLRRRQQRLAQIGKQLPDVVDLVGRALRAGHALPTALQMAASEGPEPLALEIAVVNEEIAFGVSQHEALQKLAQRVPIDDVRYLVIAVLLQRETGGNLAELLDNIGRLIRARLQLQIKVRVLSAEGRLSAWILTVLPFALAAVIAAINPELSRVLTGDPVGVQLVTASLVMMLLGIVWMRAIVSIRV
jgi:tight adherence protein B